MVPENVCNVKGKKLFSDKSALSFRCYLSHSMSVLYQVTKIFSPTLVHPC